MNTGSCLCKGIRFKVNKFEPLVGHCHCTMCQKFHGAAFSTFVEVKLHQFHWLSGKELLSSYTSENKTVRSFCNVCGASLFFESEYNRNDKTIEVSLAAFDHVDNIEGIKPDAHIFTESKASWVEINDDLAKHKTYRSE
ncbi:GFA family protein [Pseudocolwellia agarivorans]|uniref:GFA family protein n=1 Tax=Pseudocolwellia agarivorans TaxID=1911682 RepID=UPI00098502F8|nr:GFA family protein [Pseudocolwellia agarivorans]